MAILHRTLFLLALSLSPALGQTPSIAPPSAPLPVYDVVSIHENKSASNGMSFGDRDANLTAKNTNLTTLLMNAYGIRSELISGLPSWANSTRFDINAKVSDPDIDALKRLSREQRHAMLIALLADRFHLQAHVVTKTLPTYDLVVAKSGSRLKENTTLPGPNAPGVGPRHMPPGSMWMSNSEMSAVGVPISNIAANLAFRVQRNVIDKTGLTGKYDFTLKWTPDQPAGEAHDNGSNDDAPDLFTAIQEQLGLKLEPSKGPVDTLVIDHVELPTAN